MLRWTQGEGVLNRLKLFSIIIFFCQFHILFYYFSLKPMQVSLLQSRTLILQLMLPLKCIIHHTLTQDLLK